MKLALRISAIDLFSGVLRRFRAEIVGTGAEADKMQRHYDAMIKHVSAGMKALAGASYIADKVLPPIEHAARFQDVMVQTKALLQDQYSTATKLDAVMERLSNNAKAVGVHTIYGPTAVMQQQLQLVQAGVPVQAIVDRTMNGKLVHGAAYQSEAFAEANGLTPEATAKNIANVMHAYRIPYTQYGPAIDEIEKAINLGSGDATQFFHGMEQLGVIANMGHTSIRDSSVALKAIAPLGEGGGADLAQAMLYAFGGSQRGSKHLKEYGLDFYDKNHQFIGLFPMIDKLNAYVAGHHMTEQQRNMMLARGFQSTGFKAIAMLMEKDVPGAKSLQSMSRQYDKQPGLAQMVAMRETGAEFSFKEMQASIESAEITLFSPLLDKLTEAAKLTNGWAAAIDKFAQAHKGVADAVSYGSAGVVGGLGLYAGIKFIRGGAASLPFIKRFLKGKGSTAAGVAEGKLLEKMAGVTPVFVTNWPSGGIGGGVGDGIKNAATKDAEHIAEKEVGAAAGGGLFARIAARLGLTGLASSFAGLGGGGAAGAGIASIGVTGAAAGGTLVGHEISKHFIENHPERSSMIGGTLREILADWGSSAARQSLDERTEEVMGPMIRKLHKPNKPTKLEGTLRIQIDQAGRAKVASLQTNQPDLHINVGYLGLVP